MHDSHYQDDYSHYLDDNNFIVTIRIVVTPIIPMYVS